VFFFAFVDISGRSLSGSAARPGTGSHERDQGSDRDGALAARGEFGLPIAKAFPFDEWRAAVELSLSGRPHGKVVLLAPAEASV
jgi:hypothetical protein